MVLSFFCFWCHHIYKIYHLNPFWVYNSMVWSTFTLLCNHYHHPSLEHFFPSTQTETLHPLNNKFPFPIFPQPLVTTNLLSFSMNLTILDTPYKWNHTIFVLPLWVFSTNFYCMSRQQALRTQRLAAYCCTLMKLTL